MEQVSKDDFDPDSVIDKSVTTVTKKLSEEGFNIPLTVTRGNQQGVYGVVSGPPGLIPVGWTVVISPVNATDLNKPQPSDHCGDVHKTGNNGIGDDSRSIAFNVVILDTQGRERSLQELLQRENGEGLGISLTYSMTESERDRFSAKDLRYIYLEEGGDSWQLSSDHVDITGGRDGFGNISTTVSHLTSITSHNFSYQRYVNTTVIFSLKALRCCWEQDHLEERVLTTQYGSSP